MCHWRQYEEVQRQLPRADESRGPAAPIRPMKSKLAEPTLSSASRRWWHRATEEVSCLERPWPRRPQWKTRRSRRGVWACASIPQWNLFTYESRRAAPEARKPRCASAASVLASAGRQRWRGWRAPQCSWLHSRSTRKCGGLAPPSLARFCSPHCRCLSPQMAVRGLRVESKVAVAAAQALW